MVRLQPLNATTLRRRIRQQVRRRTTVQPPGTLLPFAPDSGRVVEMLVTLAPGPEERAAAFWVQTLRAGRDELEPGVYRCCDRVCWRHRLFLLRGTSGKTWLEKRRDVGVRIWTPSPYFIGSVTEG